jgi:D-aminoacyl-tRNA deacylase
VAAQTHPYPAAGLTCAEPAAAAELGVERRAVVLAQDARGEEARDQHEDRQHEADEGKATEGNEQAGHALQASLTGMRALVQRVSRAAVRVEGAEVAAIGPGLLVLLGVTHDDTEAQADRLADKLRALRVFPDADGRMNEPLGDREVLCVSQFTLYGDARKGNRPSYVEAARPEHAEPLYERVCERLGAQRGVFGALMEVELVNDGPVTLLIEL